MKIVYFSTPSFSDCDFPLLKAFASQGHKVFLLLRISPFSLKSTLVEIDRQDVRNQLLDCDAYPVLEKWKDYMGIEDIKIVNDPVGRTGLNSISLFNAERAYIKKVNPDVLCFVETPSIFRILHIARYRKRSFVVIHDPLPHSGETGIRETVKRRLAAFLSPGFILLNDRQTDGFCRKYGIGKSRIRYASLGNYECITRFYGRSLPFRYILFFGRLSVYKGIDYLIRAFRSISGNDPELRLVIAGAGEICFKIGDSDDNIVLINRYIGLDDLAGLIRGCEFVVCPYVEATQSGVIQTAFALKTPVIATDTGNFSSIVENGRTGLIVPPCDSPGLANAMERILSSRDLRKSMIENIEKEISGGRFSWDRIAGDYIRIFKNDE